MEKFPTEEDVTDATPEFETTTVDSGSRIFDVYCGDGDALFGPAHRFVQRYSIEGNRLRREFVDRDRCIARAGEKVRSYFEKDFKSSKKRTKLAQSKTPTYDQALLDLERHQISDHLCVDAVTVAESLLGDERSFDKGAGVGEASIAQMWVVSRGVVDRFYALLVERHPNCGERNDILRAIFAHLAHIGSPSDPTTCLAETVDAAGLSTLRYGVYFAQNAPHVVRMLRLVVRATGHSSQELNDEVLWETAVSLGLSPEQGFAPQAEDEAGKVQGAGEGMSMDEAEGLPSGGEASGGNEVQETKDERRRRKGKGKETDTDETSFLPSSAHTSLDSTVHPSHPSSPTSSVPPTAQSATVPLSPASLLGTGVPGTPYGAPFLDPNWSEPLYQLSGLGWQEVARFGESKYLHGLPHRSLAEQRRLEADAQDRRDERAAIEKDDAEQAAADLEHAWVVSDDVLRHREEASAAWSMSVRKRNSAEVQLLLDFVHDAVHAAQPELKLVQLELSPSTAEKAAPVVRIKGSTEPLVLPSARWDVLLAVLQDLAEDGALPSVFTPAGLHSTASHDALIANFSVGQAVEALRDDRIARYAVAGLRTLVKLIGYPVLGSAAERAETILLRGEGAAFLRHADVAPALLDLTANRAFSSVVQLADFAAELHAAGA